MPERQTATGQANRGLRLDEELARGRAGHGRRGSATRSPGQLELCPCCGRDLVYPVDWAPAGPLRWNVALRCPECEWRGGGVFAQDVVDRFDEVLDRGTQALLEDLELLARANLEEEIDRFASALRDDLILPEDF
jgi:hypothetical protein